MIKVIKNDKLKKILTERAGIYKRIGEINAGIVTLDEERTKEGYKMDKLKDKTSKILDNENIELGEFEIISRVFLEEGDCKIEILDRVEEYKKGLKEADETTTDEHKS